MLDISFYEKNGEEPYSVEVSEEIFKWLAKSEFSTIGETVAKKMVIEGEEVELKLVDLDKVNRQKLKDFFQNAIVDEEKKKHHELGDSPSKQEEQTLTYRLEKLQELRKCVENEKYQYLQRE
ncbi:hypothetical protein [Floridanema evergladense]|uniref:Uncharacterized protein n=1 Tax=Floridaenema evergladense BLCC-F167 TaxID=3153639 RepID=A0ABV4WFR2_9CYAN